MIKTYGNFFEILSGNSLTIKSRKCLFCKPEISSYAHKISVDGIKPLGEKATSAKEIRSFLGLINFLARFIANLLSETKLFCKLTPKNTQQAQGEEQTNFFLKLKNLVASKYVLSHKDQSYQIFLMIDAGLYGFCVMLVQKQSDSTIRLIHFTGRTLTSAE